MHGIILQNLKSTKALNLKLNKHMLNMLKFVISGLLTPTIMLSFLIMNLIQKRSY